MRGKKLTSLIATILILLVCAVVLSVLTYSWYQSEHKMDKLYEIPATGALIIGFSAPVAEEEISGALYPAILEPGAVAENRAGDPAAIQTPAGIVRYSTGLVLYSGEMFEGSIRLEVFANASPAGSERDLVDTGEIEILAAYTVSGVTVTHKASSDEMYMDDPQSPGQRLVLGSAALSDYIVYIREGQTVAELLSGYVFDVNDKVVFRSGYLIIRVDEEVGLTVSAYLLTVDALTAPDLRDTTVNISVTVVSPDIMEG